MQYLSSLFSYHKNTHAHAVFVIIVFISHKYTCTCSICHHCFHITKIHMHMQYLSSLFSYHTNTHAHAVFVIIVFISQKYTCTCSICHHCFHITKIHMHMQYLSSLFSYHTNTHAHAVFVIIVSIYVFIIHMLGLLLNAVHFTFFNGLQEKVYVKGFYLHGDTYIYIYIYIYIYTHKHHILTEKCFKKVMLKEEKRKSVMTLKGSTVVKFHSPLPHGFMIHVVFGFLRNSSTNRL